MTSSKPTKVGSFQKQKEKMVKIINEQEGKDVFEYSVFGSPNQKIGQFASQTKLGEWS